MSGFCDNCVGTLYEILSEQEKAVLYFLHRRESVIADVKEKIGTTKGIIAAPSFDRIGEILNCTRSMARNYVTFLFRLGLLSRSKEDHSWIYALTETGSKVIALSLNNGEEKILTRYLQKKG